MNEERRIEPIMAVKNREARIRPGEPASSRPQRTRGIVAVEFALILPLLLLIVIGTIDFGILIYNQSLLTNAAREGARWGVITSNYPWSAGCTSTTTPTTTPANPCEAANRYAASGLISFSTTTLPSTTAAGAATAGATVTVTTTYQYAGLAFNFGPLGVGGTTNLSATVKMSHE